MYRQAVGFMLSREHFAKINSPSFRFINFSKKILCKIDIFHTVKSLANRIAQLNGKLMLQAYVRHQGTIPTDLRIQIFSASLHVGRVLR